LNVLWQLGSGTVREVHRELERRQPVGYTTVLKLLQIMTEKGLVERDEKDRAHIYRPALKREETQGQIVGDLLDRVFGGSAAQLVLRALSDRKASKQEIAEIREILDNIEQGRKQ
jgi:BlaI family transcriptional regulator, penicillinase repressor